jgi:hypothetical protein
MWVVDSQPQVQAIRGVRRRDHHVLAWALKGTVRCWMITEHIPARRLECCSDRIGNVAFLDCFLFVHTPHCYHVSHITPHPTYFEILMRSSQAAPVHNRKEYGEVVSTGWRCVYRFMLQLVYHLDKAPSQRLSEHFGRYKNLLPLLGYKFLSFQPAVWLLQ